jgi:hypothetical protein
MMMVVLALGDACVGDPDVREGYDRGGDLGGTVVRNPVARGVCFFLQYCIAPCTCASFQTSRLRAPSAEQQ